MSIKSGFIKQGELIEISNIENLESCLPAVSAEVLENFRKLAHNLKKIAPKAEDFLYFSAVMMHAAEASSLNDDGTHKLNARGEKVEVGWDKSGGSWKWTTNDPTVKPYKNSNGDIFPEEELVKAYKKWQQKPLCIDHKSSSVDHVRGFIVDTYYDRNLKRVIALCALDKAGYPQLARQVSTGYSNCVSMGTAVGRAICTDCARVARTEADFCDHMRKKSCYGEINVDLNPIELSIVVNGADPKAYIKNIIASANTMQSYLENRNLELNKIADSFKANLSFENSNPSSKTNITNVEISSKDLDGFRDDVEAAIKEYELLQSSFDKEEEKSSDHTNDIASSKSPDMSEGSESGLDDSGLAPPHARYASDDVEVDSIAELHKVTASIETQINQMKQSLSKLEKTSTKIQEENMSGSKEINKKSYFQGTEEPTPGQTKYPAEPLNEKLRTDGDKHMEGESPFPGVGSVDGLHPGDLERKKLLARATAEERAMKRSAIVNLAKEALENKTAYYNNGEGPNNPNTPTPGKVKYPADKLNEQLRDKEDKHMNGQKPFPGVGSVDGLHPSPSSADVADEKKRKEMLSRASLSGKFVKAYNENGTQNLGKSAWEFVLGDKLVLKASVDDLSGGQKEIGNVKSYEIIATKEYGTKLFEKVKAHGSDAMKFFVKKAQDAVPALPEAPEAPMASAEDTSKASALDLAEKVRDLVSDLIEAIKLLTGEQAEMGSEVPEMGQAMASSDFFSSAALKATRVNLNKGLVSAMKETVASLTDQQQELEMISNMYDNGSVGVGANNSDVVNSIIADALTETKSAIADGFSLMNAFAKYARGTTAIVKQAEIEAELKALAEGEQMSEEVKDDQSGDDLMSLISDTNADLDNVHSLMNEEDSAELSDLDDDLSDDSLEGDSLEADMTVKPAELPNLPENLPPGTNVKVEASFDSRQGRAAMRAKLAADTLKWNPMLDEAHPQGGFTTDLDTKPQGDLAKVEDLSEQHDAMMGVATAPPKVRKEAAEIHRLISEGKLDPADLEVLVAEGLDKDAVSYWKKYYSQADGGSEFASELVKEHVKAEMETELNNYKVKLSRAFSLAHDMAARGLCANDNDAISDQVDAIMKFNHENFETLKRVVASHSLLKKEASVRLPNVGMINDGEMNSGNGAVLADEYSQLFAKTNKRGSF